MKVEVIDFSRYTPQPREAFKRAAIDGEVFLCVRLHSSLKLVDFTDGTQDKEYFLGMDKEKVIHSFLKASKFRPTQATFTSDLLQENNDDL